MKKIGLTTLALAFMASSPVIAQDVGAFSVADAWAKDCQKCHAEDGSGLTKKGRKLRVRDYRDAKVQAEMTDEEMIEAIAKGVEKKGEEVMNAYAEEYSEAEIEAFVAYIRAFASE